MAKRPKPKKDIDITAGGYSPLRLLMGAALKRDERKRFEKEDAEYQKALKEMGMFEEGGGRANVRKRNFMMKSDGGKLKRSVDGVATRGLTRAATKGFGKVG
jgi:hypothetical protein